MTEGRDGWQAGAVELIAPSAIYVVAWTAARLAGLEMVIQTGLYQLLAPEWLRAAPFAHLLYMHGQPPGLNALYAVVLAVADGTGLEPTTVAGAIFFVVSWATAGLTYALIRVATDSRAWAVGAVVALVANPAFHAFGNHFFYTFLINTLLVAQVWVMLRYVERGSRYLYLVVAITAGVTLMRSLYHPAWALGTVGLAVAARQWHVRQAAPGSPGAWRPAAVPLLLFVAVLTVWPLKNHALFGEFVYTSWTGSTLANTWPVENADHVSFIRRGRIARPMRGTLAALRDTYPASVHDMLFEPRKPDGSRNHYHMVILLTNDDLRAKAMDERLQHPYTWLGKIVGGYWSWSRATFVHPYAGEVLEPDVPVYRWYASAVNRVFFFDLRPLVERLLPIARLHEHAVVRRTPLPYTFFGVVLCPAVMLGGLVVLLRGARQGRPLDLALLVGWLTIVWSWLIPAAVYGAEANRMRYSSAGVFLVLAVYTLHAAVHAVRDRLSAQRA